MTRGMSGGNRIGPDVDPHQAGPTSPISHSHSIVLSRVKEMNPLISHPSAIEKFSWNFSLDRNREKEFCHLITKCSFSSKVEKAAITERKLWTICV